MNVNSINISSKTLDQLQQKLSLSPGQIIKAQVVKLEGNQVTLQFGNNLLRAQTKVELKPGDRLKLRVESSQNNLIELKIMNDNENIKPEDTILLRLGIKPQEQLEKLVQQFIKFNLPVSQEAIMEIYNLIKGNKFTEDMSQLAIWLKSVGVKVDSEKDAQALEALQSFFKGEMSGAEETRYFNFLNASENKIFGGYNIFGWPIGKNHIYVVTRGPKSERMQPENCQLFLKIDSQSFEELWFRIDLLNNKLNVDIICNSDQYKTTLEKEVSLLQNLLQSAGYQINELPIEVQKSKPTIFDLLPEQEICNINVQA